MEHGDKQLARRILDGDQRAFAEFFQRHAAALYRFAAARLGGETDKVEELTQATLFRAISKLETYRGESSLFTWLCAVCRFEISAYHRQRKRQPHLVEFVEDATESRRAAERSAVGSTDDPETALQRKEFAERVHAVLDEIPSNYGEVLEWKYADGLSAREIAGRLGLSIKAAESVLTRAREAFRARFARRRGRRR